MTEKEKPAKPKKTHAKVRRWAGKRAAKKLADAKALKVLARARAKGVFT